MNWTELNKSEDGKYYLLPIIDFDKIEDLPINPLRFRMFRFEYDGYGMSYTVLARTKEDAYKYLMEFFKNIDHDKWFYVDEAKNWEGIIIEDENTYNEGYNIIEYEEGVVLETEVC